MKEIIPYIYRLVFKPTGQVYIGSKANKEGCSPETFWKEGGYFTSSGVVKNLIKEFGTSDEFWEHKILQVFDKSDMKIVRIVENDCIIALVEELGVEGVLNKKWVVNGKVHNNTGIPHSVETKKKLSSLIVGTVTVKSPDGNIRITLEEFAKGGYETIHKGTFFCHNPITGEKKKVTNKSDIPEGWLEGMGKRVNKTLKTSEYRKNSIWITKDQVNRQINKDEPIPEGWTRGRYIEKGKESRKWTEERTQKFINAFSKKREERHLEGY